jgi:hypothetical protein
MFYNIGPRCQPLKTFLSSSSLAARAESKLACLSLATFFWECLTFVNYVWFSYYISMTKVGFRKAPLFKLTTLATDEHSTLFVLEFE